MFTSSPQPGSPLAKQSTLPPPAEAAKITAHLEVSVNQKPFASFEIGQGEHVIGRDPGCEICIDTDDVSRQHARITFTGYDLLMENLGSTNGVFVEGMKIELPTPIYPGQEIQIGRAHFRVRLSEEANRELMRALWDADLGLASVKADLKAIRYAVGATIATGGMGAVLRARDVHIRRVVAMKVMRSEMQFSPENLLRFIDEARLTGQLEHPNIVPMYKLGIDEQGRVFYTMKLIKGVTLDEVLKQLRTENPRTLERYPLAHLMNIFQKVCDAVAFAHSKSVVHRDLKPENIMIGGYGEVLVMDWGLAKIHGTRPHGDAKKPHIDSARHEHTGATFHTLDGVVVGTPPYIAPEQARGEIDSLDARTDIYGLGAVLYEILTLHPPIACTTIEEVLKKTVEGTIESPLKYNSQRAKKESDEKPVAMRHLPGGKVPESLAAVTMKALRLNPADRYQTVEDLQREIESFQGGFATTAEKAGAIKQIILLVRRHKANFALLGVGFIFINVLLFAFVMTLSHERDRAVASEQRALASEKQSRVALLELRGTAPTFAEEAQQLVDDGRFDEAMQKISYAISQVPNQSSYYTLEGHICQSMLRLDDAAKAYEAALQRNPKDMDARTNLDLSRKLLAQSGGSELSSDQLRKLQISMRSQGRYAEAVAMMEKLEQDRGLIQDTWREVFAKKKGIKGQVTANEDGTLTIDIAKNTTPQLSHLRGMPVSSLNLDDTKVSDITALTGLPLRMLNLNRTAVADLGPLRGMKLEWLSLADTRVTDLTMLRGMPLQYLNLARTHIHDLGPLRGSPVRELNLEFCRDLMDLKPLMDCPQLERLLLPQHTRAVGFLRNHPALKQLSFRKIDQPVETFWKEFDALKNNPPPGSTK